MAHAGFTTWNPTETSLQILGAVNKILEEYKDHLPLTGRQIFYRLVAAYGYEKSERAANKLYGVLGRARRAGYVPFNVIRDGGSSKSVPHTYADVEGFWLDVRNMQQHYNRNRQTGQPSYVELFCESPGMMPQLQRVAFRYSVPVYGTRGFSGLGVTAEIARRALLRNCPTVLLQVGDHDPSGESIFEVMSADARAFVVQVTRSYQRDPANGNDLAKLLGLTKERRLELSNLFADEVWEDQRPGLTTKRVALTWEQVEEYNLPTAPPSSKDSRSKNWIGETAQAEAMPPDLLARIVTEAVEGEFDLERYNEEVAAEQADEDAIDEVLGDQGV